MAPARQHGRSITYELLRMVNANNLQGSPRLVGDIERVRPQDN